jgi:hypothetical protein
VNAPLARRSNNAYHRYARCVRNLLGRHQNAGS